MAEPRLLKFDQIPVVDRGEGINTTPLVGTAIGAKVFSSGITTFPPGGAIALHTHNVDEQVTVLEGEGEAEIQGKRHPVKPYDTTFIQAGITHRFINTGKGRMRIMWVYASTNVTRTFVETGQTVQQLSPGEFGQRQV